MAEIGIRALEQNASAVIARVAPGEVLVVTDRGRPVAQLAPLATRHLDQLRSSGEARPARRSLDDLPRQWTDRRSLRRSTTTAPRDDSDCGGRRPPHVALAKFIVREPEPGSLRRWLGRRSDPMATSDLARTELFCATRRVAPDRMPQTRAVLEVVDLIRVSTEICESAGMIEPTALRSLDAIHLASTLALGDDLDVVVGYDQRVIDAALPLGIRTASPGST